MNKSILILIIIVFITNSFSQLKENQHIPGLSVGLWFHGSSPTFGINYDYSLKQAGIGIFSIGGIFRYWTYNQSFSDGSSYDYTNLVFAFQSNYNFNKIKKGILVPYVGAAIGYDNIGTKYKNFDTTSIIRHDAAFNSGVIFWVQTGFRYYFKPHLAGTARFGLGNLYFTELEIGLDYRF